MKRTNVVLDEELLEKARRAIGERTYTATITKALEDLVKKHDSQRALKELLELIQQGDYSWYHEEKAIRDELNRRTQRVSANEKRAPRRKGRVRGAR